MPFSPLCGCYIIPKNPSVLKKDVTAKQLITWIALGVFVFFYFHDNDKPKPKDKVPQPTKEMALPTIETNQPDTKPKNKEPEKPTCANDWKLCKTTGDLANQNIDVSSDIAGACKRAAEERYNQPIDWGGLFDFNFASFVPEDLSGDKKEITMVDNVAMYQNVYGAKIKTKTYCRYDLNAKKVVLIMSESK